MKDGVFIYYSSKGLEEILNKVRKDVGYSTKKRFYVDLAKRHKFDLVSTDIKINNDQFNLFQANKAQVEEIEIFFSNASKDKTFTENKFVVSEYEDVDSLISDMHIAGSEDSDYNGLKELHLTDNGEVGLTIFSPQYIELYTRVLEQALYLFDYRVATPKHVHLTNDHQYIRELNKHLIELSDFKNIKQSYKEREMLKRTVEVSDKELIDTELSKFKKPNDEQILEHQHNNKEIVSALTNTVGQLDKVTLNRKEAKSCISEIQEIMNRLNQPIKSTKTNAEYLLNLLQNINLCGYEYEPKAESISNQFRANMKRLNSAITDYHSYLKGNEVTKQGRFQKAGKMKLILRQVAIKNYNLVKQYK